MEKSHGEDKEMQRILDEGNIAVEKVRSALSDADFVQHVKWITGWSREDFGEHNLAITVDPDSLTNENPPSKVKDQVRTLLSKIPDWNLEKIQGTPYRDSSLNKVTSYELMVTLSIDKNG